MKSPRTRWIALTIAATAMGSVVGAAAVYATGAMGGAAAVSAAGAADLAAAAAETPAPAPQGRPQPTYGPVLEEFGPVYYMGEVDMKTPTDRDFKGLFDVAAAADGNDARSAAIETAARFLNMHAQAGVPRDRLGAAVVLHGAAARYALDDDAYRRRYEVDNPNLALIDALRAAGARIVICGQTAAARGYAKEELAASVELALSAMTAVKVFQDEGYQIVSF